ncbi:glycerate kinase [Pseudonocardia tropica]|uniref:Glycerate kinase n=1 Tax=Pseudonocardia tropica TaxID=681289 RepID=A0ABV1JTL5_9PSEU
MTGPLRVLVAPDSFKGSLAASAVAEALAAGWREVRPQDTVTLLPQADGGEGTVDAVARCVPGAEPRTSRPVPGPAGRPVTAHWLMLPDGSAVLDSASVCGLPLLDRPEPVAASTDGLGLLLRQVLAAGATSVTVGLGGSATTDGGAGALRGLGARLLDRAGDEIGPGGVELAQLHRIDVSGLVPPPTGGVRLLTDTRAVLTGPSGAATVFGPQKGASPYQVALLDRALARFADVLATVLPVEADRAGSGAAGGTAFGLAAWGGRILPGAHTVGELTGLHGLLPHADVVVTGEGRYDATSGTGKLVGALLQRCAGYPAAPLVVAGQIATPPPAAAIALTDLAGSVDAAIADPARWLRRAGALAARMRGDAGDRAVAEDAVVRGAVAEGAPG